MKIGYSLTRFALVILCGLWVVPASADWLDVIAERIEVKNLRTGQAGSNVQAKEGDVLEITCTEYVGLYGSHEYWEAATPQRWENRVVIDATTLVIYNAELAEGTFFSKTGTFPDINKYPPAQWVASGVGSHEASCVVNQPKKISDHVASNNVIRAMITVMASDTVVKGTLKKPPPQPAAPLPDASMRPATPAAQRAAAPSAPKVPPPKPTTPVVVVVEAESLIQTAVTSGGHMVRQDMTGFGNGWGGNAQLFWRPPEPTGAEPHLLTEFSVQQAGDYDLVLHYTTAPDFGQFTVHFDGKKLINLDGYGPQVGLNQVLLGRYPLVAGRHELAFEVTGKSPRSTGYIIGIDRLQLTSVP